MQPPPPHLKNVYNVVMAAPTSLPAPWCIAATAPIGGLTDVGFIEDTDHLLVLSSRGRGIFDCTSGECVGRDRDEDYVFDPQRLAAPAFGQNSSQTVRTAGLHGGGLALTTKDGWSVGNFVFHWPEQIITLTPPGHWV